jgi:molybdate transport system regulatory protein
MKARSRAHLDIEPRIRVRAGNEVPLGPGKAELLAWVQKTGSITDAARAMGMSYMRAWTLIRTMNACFREPLVSTSKGGNKGGGGAHLTETGQQALALYQSMDRKTLRALQPDWKKLRSLLA